MIELKSASEANRIVLEGISQSENDNMADVIAAIEEAISFGRLTVGVDVILPSTEKILINKGYKVTSGGRYNEVEYSISWKEPTK